MTDETPRENVFDINTKKPLKTEPDSDKIKFLEAYDVFLDECKKNNIDSFILIGLNGDTGNLVRSMKVEEGDLVFLSGYLSTIITELNNVHLGYLDE